MPGHIGGSDEALVSSQRQNTILQRSFKDNFPTFKLLSLIFLKLNVAKIIGSKKGQ